MAVAVIRWAPVTVGFQEQVATLFGEDPEVTRSLQLAILLPFAKKRTIEVVLTVTESVEATPFWGLPLMLTEPIVAAVGVE